jgi:hypothetical protein
VWGGGGVEKLSRDRVSESIRLREEKAYHITAEFRKMPHATCHRATQCIQDSMTKSST